MNGTALPFRGLITVGLLLAVAITAQAQRRPYIGYVYPAGGQQATSFEVKLGGQDLDDVSNLLVSGGGVAVRITGYQRKIGPQELQLLREQQSLLKKDPGGEDGKAILARVDRRIREYVQTPACAAISSLVRAEVTIQPDAAPGPRELRLLTPRGVSNPLVFHVGQLFEHTRPAMNTAALHILGKEALALRNRPESEAEVRVMPPCTMNGQIAARESNRYRFAATKGQRMVIAVQARQLIPYVADAVPGWFQPVITLYDAKGCEVAYADDYRFKPDPVILYQIEKDGDYVLEIRDSIHRGREDFIYRIALGELPFVTSVFPLGANAASVTLPEASGWNFDVAQMAATRDAAAPGWLQLTAKRLGLDSNRVPFALGELPESVERGNNDAAASAEPVTLPIVVNGRIERAGDRDTYRFEGKAGQSVAIEVAARKLDSPLDSVVTLADASGRILAANDDREDLLAGANTHHADSWLMAKLPADGVYFVQITDSARQGGEAYGYRLRISPPRPDFELRVAPTSVSVPVNGTAAVTVYVRRIDGFSGPVKLSLAEGPERMTAPPVTIAANQTNARLTLRGGVPSAQPVPLSVVGTARVGTEDMTRVAVAAEDRMQAFLWRHLVPAEALLAVVYDPRAAPVPARPAPARPVVAAVEKPTAAQTGAAAAPPKFTKQQTAGRLRQLKLLYEEGLLTDAFYFEKVAECDTPAQ